MNAKVILLLGSAALLLFLLRAPSLADPQYYLDEGVYASVAYDLGHGGTLYKTAWDLKPPGVFYVYLFFQNIFGPQAFIMQRAFNTLLGALTVLGVFVLAKRSRLHESTSYAAAFLTAIFLGLPFFETQIFNTENIFVVTSLWGIIAGLSYKKRFFEPFAAGFLFGLGQWFKIHPVFDLAAFAIFAAFKYKLDKNFWRAFIFGFLTPVIALVAYLTLNNILQVFWESTVLYNFFYVKEMPQITIFGNLLSRTIFLAAGSAALTFLKLKNKLSGHTFLLTLWFLFVFYGSLLSARAYGHYVIPAIPPLTLLLLRLSEKLGQKRRLLVLLLLAGFLLLEVNIGMNVLKRKIIDEQVNYYRTRLSYIARQTTQREFEANFTPKPWRLRELKLYLDQNVKNGESVYIWGNSPWAAYVLQRPPVQRYLMWFHVLGIREREEEVHRDLATNPPNHIIIEDNWPEGENQTISDQPPQNVRFFILANYLPVEKIAGYTVYKIL